MIDPDHNQALAKADLERRAKGQPVVDEMKAMVTDLEAELKALKRHVNSVAARYGIPAPYLDVGYRHWRDAP